MPAIILSDHFGYRKLLRFTLPTIFTVRVLVLSVAMLKKYKERYHYA